MRSEEAQLIGRFLDGDGSAVGEIDGWIKQAAWPYRRRLQQAWEDALQDVRFEVTRLLKDGRFRGDSSLKTYLWRVTNNACIDRVRSQRKVIFNDLEVIDQRGEIPRNEATESSQRRETRDLLLRVLAEMSEECIQLWRRVVAGESYREMSRDLGVSEGALRVRVLRCRKRALEVKQRLLTGANGNPA